MGFKQLILVFLTANSCSTTVVAASNEQIPGLFMESAPVGKYQSNSSIVIDQPLFIDSENGSAAEVPTGTQAIQSKSQKQKASESVGILLEAAPTNKYKNKPESTIVDVPLFLDDSAGTGGGVPLSAYFIYELDLDPGWNGTSFQDASQFVQLGIDKKYGNWTLGGSGQFVSTIDGINGSDQFNGSGVNTTRLRFQAGYGTSFGLVNIIRLDQVILTGDFKNNQPTPSYQFQRLEDYLRWDTQYSKTFYQFAGQRARLRSDGAWDYRIFAGQGFQFSDRDNLEITLWQQWGKLGLPPAGGFSTMNQKVFGLQHVSTNYSHTFSNKVTLYGEVDWEGSTYGQTSYQNSFGAEAGVRIPF